MIGNAELLLSKNVVLFFSSSNAEYTKCTKFHQEFLHCLCLHQLFAYVHCSTISDTVVSRYLELGYLEVYESRSVHLNQKYILIAFSNHNLALETFLQVQITRSAN